MHFAAWAFDRASPILCSGGIFPEIGFDGVLLHRMGEVEAVADFVALSVVNTPVGGLVIFTWVDPSPSASRLIDSLVAVPDAAKPNAIARFVFEFFENVYLEPAWWEALPNDTRSIVKIRARAAADVRSGRPEYVLEDDGITLLTASIASYHCA